MFLRCFFRITKVVYFFPLDGFKATDKTVMEGKYEDQRNRGDEPEEAVFPTKTTSMAFALQTVHGFKTLAHFCMGTHLNFVLYN